MLTSHTSTCKMQAYHISYRYTHILQHEVPDQSTSIIEISPSSLAGSQVRRRAGDDEKEEDILTDRLSCESKRLSAKGGGQAIWAGRGARGRGGAEARGRGVA